jgi:hypothetical protein
MSQGPSNWRPGVAIRSDAPDIPDGHRGFPSIP